MWQFTFRISNAVVTAFLYLLKSMLLYLGNAFQCEQLQKMSDCIPLTLNTVHRIQSHHKDNLLKYAVRPSCDSTYE